MIESEIEQITLAELPIKVLAKKNDGWRIVQICAVRTPGGYELSYSFAKEYRMVTFRFAVGEEEEVVSISNVYSPAFLYENEVRDLFGVKIRMIGLDYGGNLYRIETKTPFRDK